MSWLLLLVPLGGFTFFFSRQKNLHLGWLLFPYAYGLVLLTSVGSFGFQMPDATLPPELTNYIRSGLHVLVFILLGFQYLNKRAQNALPAESLLALSTLTLASISIFINHQSSQELLRPVLTFLMISTLLVFLPTIFDKAAHFRLLANTAIYSALIFSLISLYAIARYGPYPEWTTRLGRPLNPGVLSYLTGMGLISAVVLKVRPLFTVALFVSLVLSASRLDLGIAGIYIVFLVVRNRRQWLRVGLAAGVAGLIVFGVYAYAFADADTIQPLDRSEVTSGRIDVWRDGIEEVMNFPWLGRGTRFFFDVKENERVDADLTPLRAHNMILENALSYGIPAAALSVLIYFAFMFKLLFRVKSNVDPLPVDLARGTLLLVMGHMLFDTSSWLNLGDAPTLLSLAMIAPAVGLCCRRVRIVTY